MSEFQRGFLTKPAVKRLCDRWRDEDEAQRIKEQNEEIYLRAIRLMWAQPERKEP